MHEKNKTLILNAQSGDNKSLEKLIQKNNGLIWNVVRKFWYTEIDTDDLYQLACIGFIKAVKRFNFKYNVELSTYATEYIFGEIKKFIRDDGMIKVSRNIKELNKKINDLEKKYGSDLKTDQIAEILNISEDKVISAIRSRKKVESINQYIYEGNQYSKIEKISENSNYEDNIIEKIVISDLINNLKLRDKTIIKLRFFKEKTQSQIANMLGISQVQVSRIEKRALIELKNGLTNSKI